MLFGPDSFLRRPPTGILARDRIWIEGAGFAIALADLAYARLHALLDRIAQDGTIRPGEDANALALADAWSYVDHAHRLSDLLDVGMFALGSRELSRLGREFQGISRALLDLRNDVQHVTGELPNIVASGVPVCGFISWAHVVNPAPPARIRCLVLTPSGGGQTVQSQAVNPAGQSFITRTDHIHLEAFGKRGSISDSYRSLVAFARECESTLQQRYPAAGREFPGGLFVIDIEADEGSAGNDHA